MSQPAPAHPQLFIGHLVDCAADPFVNPSALRVRRRGGLLVGACGTIMAIGDPVVLRSRAAKVTDLGQSWLLPGFVDGHVHFPQVFASHVPCGQLLEWLNGTVFPREARLADQSHAQEAAAVFCRELVTQGTTCAAIYGSQFPQAGVALLNALESSRLRACWGPTLMDLGPASLCRSIAQWDGDLGGLERLLAGKSKQNPSLVPRFLLSCSDGLLELVSHWAKRHPEWLIQTHVNENSAEIAAVRERFPARSYLAQIAHCGLLSRGSLLAHNIHLSPADLDLLASAGCTTVHCPSSNLFLGSGLFSLVNHLQRGIATCLGSDMGAGSSFSMAMEAADCQKVQALQGLHLSAVQLLFLITTAGATALGLERERGCFEKGMVADFTVWHGADDPYLAARLNRVESDEEALFVLLARGKPRATYIDGLEA
jgi:guanine deaminase